MTMSPTETRDEARDHLVHLARLRHVVFAIVELHHGASPFESTLLGTFEQGQLVSADLKGRQLLAWDAIRSLALELDRGAPLAKASPVEGYLATLDEPLLQLRSALESLVAGTASGVRWSMPGRQGSMGKTKPLDFYFLEPADAARACMRMAAAHGCPMGNNNAELVERLAATSWSAGYALTREDAATLLAARKGCAAPSDPGRLELARVRLGQAGIVWTDPVEDCAQPQRAKGAAGRAKPSASPLSTELDDGDSPLPETPLVRAIRARQRAAVEELLASGASPNERGSSFSPLGWAARLGDAGLCRLLLDAGADPLEHPPHLLLNHAARAKSLEVARLLLDAGAGRPIIGYLALLVRLATAAGDEELLRRLAPPAGD